MRSTKRDRSITVPDAEAKRILSQRTRRGFMVGAVGGLAGLGAYEWLTKSGGEDGTPWPQRRVLAFNEKLAHGYLNDAHLMPSYRADQITFLKQNGDIGLTSDLDRSKWRLNVSVEDETALHLTLADVMNLPKVEMITRFCCIEGWSVITSWGGARFSDFTRKFSPPGRQLPPYVYMTTPDEEYFVGLDAKSAMHPQTLLAYEHNGKPLAEEHGAPLRLVIPVKYGIKNIKRIGTIRYTGERPDDYWAQEGYDWFAGL